MMNLQSLSLFAFLLLLAACAAEENPAANPTASPALTAVMQDTTPRVTGIGGIFFLSEDPKAINAWYGQNLGLVIDDFGSPFEFRSANAPDEPNYLRWSSFEKTTDYFDPSDKPFMINYRVHNLEGLVRKLEANGVDMLDSIATYEYGKFVHLLDPEGNKIELWEPVDSFFTQLGQPATK